jgi:hypothetical protein
MGAGVARVTVWARRGRAVGVAVALAVGVVACSSTSDDEERSASTTTTAASESGREEEAAPEPLPGPGDARGGGTTKTAPGEDPSDDEASPIGAWEGTYTCTQGVTGLTLTIEEGDEGGGSLVGTFEFYAVDENPGVPSGSFALEGTFAGGDLELLGTEWIDRPGDYVTVDLHASADQGDIGPDHMTGTVTASAGASDCTSFDVDRS